MDELFKLAEKLRGLREKKDAQAAILKQVNSDIDDTETKLAEAMTAAECPNFTRGDKQFILTSTTRWSAETDKKERLYDALKEQGYEHLFTVNTNTLGSFVRDMAADYAEENDGEDGLPDWLIGLVKSYDDVGITMKKATAKK